MLHRTTVLYTTPLYYFIYGNIENSHLKNPATTVPVGSWTDIMHISFSQMKESIVDEQESSKEENIHLTRFLRVLANFLIICCLCGSGYLIYFVVKRSQEFSKMQNVSWYERNEVRRAFCRSE